MNQYTSATFMKESDTNMYEMCWTEVVILSKQGVCGLRYPWLRCVEITTLCDIFFTSLDMWERVTEVAELLKSYLWSVLKVCVHHELPPFVLSCVFKWFRCDARLSHRNSVFPSWISVHGALDLLVSLTWKKATNSNNHQLCVYVS